MPSYRLAPLVLAVALTGCANGPDVVRVAPHAAATVAPVGPALDLPGPFRRTDRQEYRWRISSVTAERLGSSHRAGCPVRVEDLRLLEVSHWDLEGELQLGELVVHAAHARPLVDVFRALHDARFPIAGMTTVEEYGGSDASSMADNNSSAYNCRTTTGGSRWSEHAYGTSIDLNPVQNPYVSGSTVEPEAGRAYLDRSHVRPGMIVAGDVVVRAFAAIGWEWGGSWSSLKDYQHFSASGR